MPKSRRKRKRTPVQRTSGRVVWHGARAGGPFLSDEASRSIVTVWASERNGRILHHEVTTHAAVVTDELKRVLFRERPLALRVADPSWAAQLQAEVPHVKVSCGPAPMADEAITAMTEDGLASGGPVSYLQNGVTPDAIREFLAACAQFLIRLWATSPGLPSLLMDIPELGIEAYSVNVATEDGVSLIVSADPGWFDGPDDMPDMGRFSPDRPLLTVAFMGALDVTGLMQNEASELGWDWDWGADAVYPVPLIVTGDTPPAAADARHYGLLTACLQALFAVLADPDKPALPAPLDLASDGDAFEIPSTIAGSVTLSVMADTTEAVHPVLAMDFEVLMAIDEWADERSGFAWEALIDSYYDEGASSDLALALAAYGPFDVKASRSTGHLPDPALPIARQFLMDVPQDDEKRRWIEAQVSTHLSLWQVEAVDPDTGTASLEDMLTGERALVVDLELSRSVSPRGVLLGRVVGHEGESFLAASDGHVLSPADGNALVERMRRYLRRRRLIPRDLLLPPRVARYLLRAWDDAMEQYAERPPPTVYTPDGEELEFLTDTFRIDEGARSQVADLLAREYTQRGKGIYDVAPGKHGIAPSSIELGEHEVTVTSLTVSAADATREALLKMSGGVLSHRGRKILDLADAELPELTESPAQRLPGPEENEVVLAFKTQHYATWIDESLPALGGDTPRRAVRTATGRASVRQLIDEMEYAEARQPAGQRYDMNRLREQLGLD